VGSLFVKQKRTTDKQLHCVTRLYARKSTRASGWGGSCCLFAC